MDFLKGGDIMKIVCSIYQIEQLHRLKDTIDYAILMVPNISLNYMDLDIDLAISYCLDNHIGIILAIDKLYLPKEIDLVSKFIDKYQNLCDYFYITDLGIGNLMITKKCQNKVIFDPKTMICNSLDLSIYNSLGFEALGLSSEITKEDILSIYDKTKANIFYQIFGYRLMFYSKRNLISLYEKKNNATYPHEAYLKEATRNDYFPILENENGTLIYRSYLISYMEYLDEIKDLKYGFIESYLLDLDKLEIITKTFKGLLNKEITIDMARLNILKLDLHIEDGFMFKDSVYEKKELKL